MKVLVGGISHESNTFCNVYTGMRQFEASRIAYGDDIPPLYAGTNTSLGGFLDAAGALGLDPVCTVAAGANPSGPVVRSAYEHFKARILAGLAREPVAGVYLALHGAMVVAGLGDGEGDLLLAVRAAVGPRVPIVVTLDLHTLMTTTMLANADLLILFKTYPHVDMAARAAEAARLLARLIRGEIRPTAGYKPLPLLGPFTRMRTALEPMAAVGRRMVELESSGEVLTASFNHSFPYSDFDYVGAGGLVYTDGDPARAEALAAELADYVWDRRAMLWHTPTTVPEAIDRALRHPTGPVVVADTGDNPGGGAASDGVELLRELIRRDAPSAAFGTVWDPGAVELCWDAGEGATVDLRLGGKTDRHTGAPLDLVATVERLCDGRFTYKGPMSQGMAGNLGRTAVLRVGGVRVIVNEARTQNYDPEIFRCAGIEPTEQQVLVVKSVVHFRAAYEPIASLIIEADGPGVSSLDLRRFPFQHLRRPMAGLDRC